MLKTTGDIKNEVLVRTNSATTTTFITDSILNDWLRDAHDFACGYKKWTLTEGRISTTFSTSNINDMGDVVLPYPEGWKPDSIRLLQIGGKRMEKITLEDYQIFREEQSESTSRVYSDFGLEYYINPLADVSGTLTVWGQYTPIIDPTDESADTVFSKIGNEGNEAIVNEMISYLKMKDTNPNEAEYYHKKSTSILDGIWDKTQSEQFNYHTKDRGMFKRIDIISGKPLDEMFKRDQFY